MPYGEPDNDWLRLDLRRVQNPTKSLSNNQITGYIAITGDHNPSLHDRSHREGLDNNSSYSDLQNIMKLVLTELENIRFVSRRPNEQEDDKNKEQKGLFQSPDFSSIVQSVNNEKPDKKVTIDLISKAESDWKKQIKKLQNVLSQYHALATLGGIVDKVLHDGRQPLAKIQTEAGLGYELAEDLVESDSKSKEFKLFKTGFKKIVSQSSVLRDVFRRIEPFGGRKKGAPKKYYIENLIKDIFSIYESDLSESNIKTELPNSETLVSIDTTELSEIFTNLITNSIYWLKSVDENKRYIRVLLSRQHDSALEILFSDTGPGVDKKYKDHIFEPYFSRKSGGHGLGLCLVGEIVQDYYNGSVELLNSGSKSGAVFRIILRKRV